MLPLEYIAITDKSLALKSSSSDTVKFIDTLLSSLTFIFEFWNVITGNWLLESTIKTSYSF